MSEQVQVSIICNTFNHERYIRDALEGFVMQKTSFPFEVLIHDDASTDHTADIIREYEHTHPDLIIPIYETENQYSKHDGTIRRLQEGRTKGKYVALCEGDDYWTDPLKLQKQFDFMELHPNYSLCGCSTVWLNMLTGKDTGQTKTEQDKDLSLSDFLNPKNGRPFPYVSFFVKTDVWKNRPNWGFPVGDLPMTYYAAMQGKVRMLADTMCVYRWNVGGSWTARNADPEKRAATCEKMIRGMEKMNEDTDYRYKDVINKAIAHEKYTLALMQQDFKAIQSEELIGLYKNRDLIHRLSDRIRCTAPDLYRIVQRIIGRNR